MAIVTPAARRLLAADGVTFVLRDGDLCYYAEEDAVSPLWKGRRFPTKACISGWCMQRGQAARIADIYQDPRIPHDAYRPTFVRSLAMAPVPRDQPIAAMGAYWAVPHDASSEELDVLQMVADASALAVANVQALQGRAVKEAEGQELAHRIKNLFAVVQALVQQGEAETLAEYRESLLGRLRLLQRLHVEMSCSGVDGVELETLLHRLFDALAADRGDCLHLVGPPVALRGQTAQDVALMTYELATNAVKHGALSAPQGRLDIRWELDGELLQLHWKERGGLPVSPPERQGFGTRYVKGCAEYQRGGAAELSYEPDGFRCELTLRVSDD